MIKDAIKKVIEGKDLSEKEALDVMNEIMGGDATPAQIAAFLTALRLKGETVDEIFACATVMRQKAESISVQGTAVDTCGTGGDCAGTFNISTTVAFVVAGAGVSVAKHGNRSVSSRSGSADLLESLGAEPASRVLPACGSSRPWRSMSSYTLAGGGRRAERFHCQDVRPSGGGDLCICRS